MSTPIKDHLTDRVIRNLCQGDRAVNSPCNWLQKLDHVFVERLWRTVKYENIHLRDYASVLELEVGLHAYFHFYNHERLHQSLGYHTPAEMHCA